MKGSKLSYVIFGIITIFIIYLILKLIVTILDFIFGIALDMLTNSFSLIIITVLIIFVFRGRLTFFWNNVFRGIKESAATVSTNTVQRERKPSLKPTKKVHWNVSKSNGSEEQDIDELKKDFNEADYQKAINNYYLQGLSYLRNEEFLNARDNFEKAANLSEKERLLPDIGLFCRGMVWYEDAPDNYTGGKPTEYLNALECFIEALGHGYKGDYIYFYLGDTAAKLGGGKESNYFDEKSKFFYRLLAMQSYIKSIKNNETAAETSFFKLDLIHSPQNRTDEAIVAKAQIFFKSKFDEFFSLAEMGIGDWLDIYEIEWDSYKYDLFVRNFFAWLSEFNLNY